MDLDRLLTVLAAALDAVAATLRTVPSPAVLPELLRLPTVLIPVLVGVAVYLLLIAHPRLRPYRPLWEEVDELEAAGAHREESPVGPPGRRPAALRPFARPIALVWPLVEDVGGLVRRARAALHLREPARLEADLDLALPGTTPRGYYGQMAVLLVLGPAVPGGLNGLGVPVPVAGGPWPAWLMVALAVLGGLAMPWWLRRALRRRRDALAADLPAALAQLETLATGAASPRRAVTALATEGDGPVAAELLWAVRLHDRAPAGRPFSAALEAMAERNGVPALDGLVETLRSALDEGTPLPEALAARLEGVCVEQEAELTERLGRRQAVMMAPVVAVALPALIGLLVAPFAARLAGLF
jgi:hypothetical protein